MPVIFLLFSLFFSSESTFTSKNIGGVIKETTKKPENSPNGQEYIISNEIMP